MPFICISGMHRSGTSLAARVLNLLGVYLGPQEALMPATEDNPRGYWEAQAISDLNEALLGYLGGRWHQVPPLPDGWERDEGLDPFRQRAARLLEELFGDSPLVGFKDPRVSLVLPFWRTVTEVDATLLVVRSPDEVAGSLKRRNGFESERSGGLWLDYVGAACAHSPQQPVITYDALLRDPTTAAGWLVDALGLPQPTDETLAAIEATADRRLQRNTPHVDEAGSQVEAARSLYELLTAREAHSAQGSAGQLFLERNEARLRAQAISERDEVVHRQETELQQLRAELEELVSKREWLGEQQERLQAEVAALRDQLDEANATAAQRSRELTGVQQTAARWEREFRRLRSRRAVRAALAASTLLRPIFRAVRRFRSSRLRRSPRTEHETASPHRAASEDEAGQMQRRLEAQLPSKPRTTGPKVSIVVLNRNGKPHLERLFERLDATEYEPFEVIVVDNASEDDSLDFLADSGHRVPVSVIRNELNTSFSEGNNQGITATDGELVLLLNNDIEPIGSGWLGHFVDTLLTSGAAAAGARLVYPRRPHLDNAGDDTHPDLTLQHRGIHFELAADGIPAAQNLGSGESPLTATAAAVREVPAVTAACLLTSRAVLDQVGGLTSGYQYGTEDVDLCLKLRDRGYHVVYDGQVVLWHHEYGTQNREGRERKRQNRLHNRSQFVDTWGSRLFREVMLDKLSGSGYLSETPLHVGITVTKDDAEAGYGDWYVAADMAVALESLGWQVSFVERYDDRWYDLGSDLDVLLVLLDAFELPRAPSHLTTIAWVRNWTERWISRPWFEDYDLVLASSQRSKDIIESRTAKIAHLLPLATNPDRFRPETPQEELRCDVVFVGNYWNQPRDIVDALISMPPDIDVRIYGHGWEKHAKARQLWHGALSYERIPVAYSSAQIVLDDTADHARPYGALNARVFDALATGSLVITDNPVGAEELFDSDFPVWHDHVDLVETVRRNISDPRQLDHVVARYQQKVHEEHTYEKRATALRDILREWYESERAAILVGVPRPEEKEHWGDYHFARAVQRQLERRNRPARVVLLPAWGATHVAQNDLVVHIFGLSDYVPRSCQTNVLWNISHPELMTGERCDQYEVVCIASDEFAEVMSQKTEVEVHALHQATDPERFHPDPSGPHHQLLFVGNSRRVRRRIIDDVAGTPYEVAVYGREWTSDLVDPRCVKGTLIPNAELRQYYSSADVVLNDHWDQMRQYGFISNRIYDALACSACVVSDEVSGLDREFGGAVATYGSRGELRDLLDRLMGDAEERRERGRRGRAVVLERHTFGVRVEELLGIVRPHLVVSSARILS